jgi:hypothetical protein
MICTKQMSCSNYGRIAYIEDIVAWRTSTWLCEINLELGNIIDVGEEAG